MIARAAAQVTCQECTDLIIGRIGILTEQCDSIHHKAGVAETALVSTLIGNKPDKVRGFFLQTLQSMDLMAVGTDSKSGTRQNRLTIHQHSTKTAVGGIAATLDRQTALFPQEIQQDSIRFHGSSDISTIELQFHFHITYPPVLPCSGRSAP